MQSLIPLSKQYSFRVSWFNFGKIHENSRNSRSTSWFKSASALSHQALFEAALCLGAKAANSKCAQADCQSAIQQVANLRYEEVADGNGAITCGKQYRRLKILSCCISKKIC
jgi:hypothetical protein